MHMDCTQKRRPINEENSAHFLEQFNDNFKKQQPWTVKKKILMLQVNTRLLRYLEYLFTRVSPQWLLTVQIRRKVWRNEIWLQNEIVSQNKSISKRRTMDLKEIMLRNKLHDKKNLSSSESHELLIHPRIIVLFWENICCESSKL